MAGMTITPTNKRTIRQQTNPLDKATIVSVYPKPLRATYETIQPGKFYIEAGSESNPSVLVVGPSSWWRDIGEEMPLIEIPNGSLLIAQAIVTDYCNSMIEVDEISSPGFFYVPGELNVSEIMDKYSKTLKETIQKQKNWFHNLVKIADADWARSNGNPKHISDLSRMAAVELGFKDRDWMKNTVQAEKIKCVACGNLRNPEYPICPSCNRVVDVALAKKLGIMEPTK